MTLSRIEIPILAPTTAFNVMIPVTFPNQVDNNLYIGFQVVNSTTGFKSLAYVEPLRLVSISQTSSNSGSFGPVVSSVTVGQNVTNMQLRATSPIGLTANTGNNIGSAFSYFS